MSNAIKCIIRQGWTTRDADGNLIERRDYVYVTNEDGTPHIYASIAEARDAIRRHTGDPLAKYRSIEYLEFDEPRPTYQRAELLAYLGEPDDYDVTAIEHEATAYDAATGRTVWAVDAETLAVIAERHQLQFYAPAF